MPGQTILVIDTDLETMQRMISILESEDYLVFTASNRESSITMAQKVNPSLIFINIGMSGVSGLEISKMIHETETLQEIPIIIVTPHGGTVDPRYTSVYGIVDFMPKEFSPEDLVATTKKVLGQQPESPQLFEEGKPEEPSDEIATEEPFSEDIPIIQEEPTVQANIQEEPEEMHIPEEVISQEEPLLEEPAGLSEEQPLERSPLPEEEEQEEATPPPVFSEIHEEPPLDDQPEKTEEVISPQIIEPEKKKNASKMLPLLILLLIIAAGAGIFYYTTQRGTEKPLETAALDSEQAVPKASEQTAQPEASKTRAAETEKPQPKPSPASQTKTYKSETQASTPSVKEPSAPSPAPSSKKSPAVSNVGKQATQKYSVQVGAFRDRVNAVTYAKQLVEKGYDARVHKTDLAEKGTLYKVLIGKFDQKKEAAQMARTVRMKEETSTVLFHE